MTPSHFAYNVRNREGGDNYWIRIGSAWAHADGNGFNIQLETVPLDGRVALRTATEKINNQLGHSTGWRAQTRQLFYAVFPAKENREYVDNANWRCLQKGLFLKTGNRVDGYAGKKDSQFKPVAAFDLICVIYILPKKIWLGQPMSKRPCHAGRMKIPKSVSFLRSRFDFFNGAGRKLIAAFGTARLVRNQNGRHELIGGTADDHATAREWCSLFAPEVVFSGTPRRNLAVAFAA